MHACMYVFVYLCMFACLCVCVCVCVYVCVYVCVCLSDCNIVCSYLSLLIVVSALQDPRIISLIEALRSQPSQAGALTARALSSPTLARKVAVLKRAGILGLAT